MSKKKILVVDDNPVVLKALSMKLASEGIEVVTATDGSKAMQAARKEDPDLILLDLNFPVEVGMSWDGFSIMRWLRRPVDGTAKPIIVITGEGTRNRDRCMQMGANAFFQKPVNHEELLAKIKECLEASNETEAEATEPAKP